MKHLLLIGLLFSLFSCSKKDASTIGSTTTGSTTVSNSAKVSLNTYYGSHIYDVVSIPFVLQFGYLDGELKSSTVGDSTSIKIHFSFQGKFDTVPMPHTYDDKSVVQYGYGSVEYISGTHTIFTWGTGKGDNAMSMEMFSRSGTTLNGYISTGIGGKKTISGPFKFTYTEKK